jgi:hypothetical protein
VVGYHDASRDLLDPANGLGVVGDDVGSLDWPAPRQSKEVQADAVDEEPGLGSTGRLLRDGRRCRLLGPFADFLAPFSSLLDSRGVRRAAHGPDQKQLQSDEHFPRHFGLGLEELGLHWRPVHQADPGQGLLAEVDDRLGYAALGGGGEAGLFRGEVGLE